MSYYESNVDKVLGVLPEYRYGTVGDVTYTSRGFAKSVLMPGHLLVDIYAGDEEAIGYAIIAGYATAAAMTAQLVLTGSVSERALYGLMKSAERTPALIIGYEAGMYVRDIGAISAGKTPKSLSLRAVYSAVSQIPGKGGRTLKDFKFMERN